MDAATNNTTASNVAQAILAVLDYNSTPDARRAAVAFLESVISLKTFTFFLLSCDRFACVDTWFCALVLVLSFACDTLR